MKNQLHLTRFLETSPHFFFYGQMKQLEQELREITLGKLPGQGLTFLETLLILAVYWGPASQVTPKNLSLLLHLSPSQVSQLLGQLEKKDLIQRKNSLRDARIKEVTLKRKGKGLVTLLVNHFEKIQQKWEKGGRESDLTVLRLYCQ